VPQPAEVGKSSVFPDYLHPTKTPPSPQKRIPHYRKRK